MSYKSDDINLIWEKYMEASLPIDVICEGYQEYVNQATKVLRNNGFPDDAETHMRNLERIYREADRVLEADAKNRRTDDHLVSLAYMFMSDQSIDLLKQEYEDYLQSTMAAQNELSKRTDELLGKIKREKLFKEENKEAKFVAIREFFSSLVSEIHLQKSQTTETRQISDDYSEDVVYEDDNIKVYLADSRIKCIRYGEPHLCISWRGANNYYWKYRMGRMRKDDLGMTTYFVVDKNDGNKYLIDSMGDEDGPADKYSYNPVSPNVDSDITPEALFRKHPEVKPAFERGIFEFIPYGEKEVRFNHIDQNINSITHPELKDIEDYWMFIEAGKKIQPKEWEQLPKSIFKDALVKYISVAENFNIPDEILNKAQPSDVKKYRASHLKRVEEWVGELR